MDLFIHATEPDTADERTCGTCMERKQVSEFYKDGTDSEGNIKYRRDCKQCYSKTRLAERRAKKPKPTPATRTRGKKK